MARANMTTSGPTMSTPIWMKDFASRDHLVPGPHKVDAAQFAANTAGRKHIPSGTPLGRTIAERNAGTGFGPALETDDEVFLLAFDIDDATANPDATMYRPGAQVAENFLPGYGTTITVAVLAKIRTLYLCMRGAA